jgi:hypothetical protein
MKHFIVKSKTNDYGICNIGVIYSKESEIKNYVYSYEEIPEEDYRVLKKYVEEINNTDYQDFGFKKLSEYLEEYY